MVRYPKDNPHYRRKTADAVRNPETSRSDDHPLI
jgi:hypothetical protein